MAMHNRQEFDIDNEGKPSFLGFEEWLLDEWFNEFGFWVVFCHFKSFWCDFLMLKIIIFGSYSFIFAFFWFFPQFFLSYTW